VQIGHGLLHKVKRNDSLLHICKKNKRKIARNDPRRLSLRGHFGDNLADHAKIFVLRGSDLQINLLFFADSRADNLGIQTATECKQ
jgi:hypothetical protein